MRLTGAFDVGKAINPDFVEGQITGENVIGIGWALAEDLIIEKGKILNGSFTGYRLLRTNDVPKLDSIIVESHEPTGPFGAKGLGGMADRKGMIRFLPWTILYTQI